MKAHQDGEDFSLHPTIFIAELVGTALLVAVGLSVVILDFGDGYLSKRYDMSPDTVPNNVTYTAWTADSYFEYPLGGGSIAAEAAYYDYDKGAPENPRIKAWYAQTGYLLPGKIGPGQLDLLSVSIHTSRMATRQARRHGR